jgi:hypothetical protein
MTAPAYKLAKLVIATISHVIPLPNTFNLKNLIQLMQELRQIPYNENIWLVSFDVKNMYTNIPTGELPRILKLLCTQHGLTTTFTRDLIKLMHLLLKQNYFSFHDSIYLQTQGLTMGAPTSPIFSELFLQ